MMAYKAIMEELPKFKADFDKNYDFLSRIVEAINSSYSIQQLKEKIFILFSEKISNPAIRDFDYGWLNGGILEIMYGEIIVISVETGEDLEDDDD